MLEVYARNSPVVLNASMGKDELVRSAAVEGKKKSSKRSINQHGKNGKLFMSSSSLEVEPKRPKTVKEDSPTQLLHVGKKRTLAEFRESHLTADQVNPNWKSAYDTFMAHVSYEDDGTYDCNGIFSRECYEDWLNSRQKTPKHPEESYRRALIGHVTGDSRRKPFPPEIESCVLERLREKKVWECFKQDEESTTRIGAQGFRKMGYHESRTKETELNTSLNSEESSLLIPFADYVHEDTQMFKRDSL